VCGSPASASYDNDDMFSTARVFMRVATMCVAGAKS
jgi:hypothetical protein